MLPSLTPDVAITVALAHCDIASRVMSGSGASVEDAYEELEAAIATLVKYRAPNEQLKKGERAGSCARSPTRTLALQ